MPTYRQATEQVGDQAEAALLALWAQVEAGQISREEFDDTATVLLDAAADRAAYLADTALASRLTELRGEYTDPLGIVPPDTGAAQEVAGITAGAAAAVAIGVAARSITRAAGQAVWSQGLQDHGVPGWRRVTSGGGCPPCSNLAVADFIASHVLMWAHKGCGCHPDPVLDDPQAPEVVEGPVLVQGEDF